MGDDSANSFPQNYLDYEKKVRKGHHGKTATLWVSVIGHLRLIMMLQYFVKTNNLILIPQMK